MLAHVDALEPVLPAAMRLLVELAVAAIVRDVLGEFDVGVEPHVTIAAPVRLRFGECQEACTNTLPCRSGATQIFSIRR